jgi:hypothetical protein
VCILQGDSNNVAPLALGYKEKSVEPGKGSSELTASGKIHDFEDESKPDYRTCDNERYEIGS